MIKRNTHFLTQHHILKTKLRKTNTCGTNKWSLEYIFVKNACNKSGLQRRRMFKLIHHTVDFYIHS